MKSIIKKINKFKLKVFSYILLKFVFIFFLLYKKMNVMFGSWKVLRKKILRIMIFFCLILLWKISKKPIKKIIYLFWIYFLFFVTFFFPFTFPSYFLSFTFFLKFFKNQTWPKILKMYKFQNSFYLFIYLFIIIIIIIIIYLYFLW